MDDLKPENNNNFIDLARAKRVHTMAKVDEHDKTMVDFKTSHPDDYVVNPDFWALKKESYKLRDAYYEAKERFLDCIFYSSSASSLIFIIQ